MSATSPSAAHLRNLIAEAFRTDCELGAFLCDYFPNVDQKLTLGMNRTEKVTLLFRMEDLAAVSAALLLAQSKKAWHRRDSQDRIFDSFMAGLRRLNFRKQAIAMRQFLTHSYSTGAFVIYGPESCRKGHEWLVRRLLDLVEQFDFDACGSTVIHDCRAHGLRPDVASVLETLCQHINWDETKDYSHSELAKRLASSECPLTIILENIDSLPDEELASLLRFWESICGERPNPKSKPARLLLFLISRRSQDPLRTHTALPFSHPFDRVSVPILLDPVEAFLPEIFESWRGELLNDPPDSHFWLLDNEISTHLHIASCGGEPAATLIVIFERWLADLKGSPVWGRYKSQARKCWLTLTG
jgi:hypothetical protein